MVPLHHAGRTINYLCSAEQLHASSHTEGPQLLEKLDNFSSEYTLVTLRLARPQTILLCCAKTYVQKEPSLIKIEQPALWL